MPTVIPSRLLLFSSSRVPRPLCVGSIGPWRKRSEGSGAKRSYTKPPEAPHSGPSISRPALGPRSLSKPRRVFDATVTPGLLLYPTAFYSIPSPKASLRLFDATVSPASYRISIVNSKISIVLHAKTTVYQEYLPYFHHYRNLPVCKPNGCRGSWRRSWRSGLQQQRLQLLQLQARTKTPLLQPACFRLPAR